MSILILGDPTDPHVSRVSNMLLTMGEEPVVLHRHNLSHSISLRLSAEGTFVECKTGDKKVAGEDVSAIWSRVKPIVLAVSQSSEERLGEEFAAQEWRFVHYSMPHLFPSAAWVNPLPNQSRAAIKPFQLDLARRVGFRIPETRITNDPVVAAELCERHVKSIYKTLTNFVFPPDQYIYTTLITEGMVRDNAARVQRAPGIFQEYIEKKFELRVTVVGSKCFATKINSQLDKRNLIDWRVSQINSGMYETFTLAEATKDMILRFHSLAGLVYAAYDFIVSEDGEIVFLECNPAGQWLWLEEATGQGISEAVASTLVRGSCEALLPMRERITP